MGEGVNEMSAISSVMCVSSFACCSLQNVCLPEIRGTAFALFTLTDDIGKGLGPGTAAGFNLSVSC